MRAELAASHALRERTIWQSELQVERERAELYGAALERATEQIEALENRVFILESKVGNRGLEAMERNVEALLLTRETERLAALADKPRRDAEDLRTQGLEAMAALDYGRACDCFRAALSLSAKYGDPTLTEDVKLRLEGARAAERCMQERANGALTNAEEHPAEIAAKRMPRQPLTEKRNEAAVPEDETDFESSYSAELGQLSWQSHDRCINEIPRRAGSGGAEAEHDSKIAEVAESSVEETRDSEDDPAAQTEREGEGGRKGKKVGPKSEPKPEPEPEPEPDASRNGSRNKLQAAKTKKKR